MRPAFVDDLLVRDVLTALLDRADARPPEERRRAPRITLGRSATPAWFGSVHGDAKAFSWRRLEELAKTGVLRLSKVPPFADAPWQIEPSIYLTVEGEPQVRAWLARPFPEVSAVIQWRRAVLAVGGIGERLREALLGRPLMVGQRPAAEVLARLLRAHQVFDRGLARRVVSAKAFWGLSKVLDQRDDLLSAMAGETVSPWRRQPLLMHVHASRGQPDGLLFVENLEAFEAVCAGIVPVPPRWWVLYSAGFKGASQRLTQADAVRWYTEVGAPRLTADELRDGVSLGEGGRCAVCFWGDLDFAGLAILRDIRRAFPQARAWHTGYAPLLSLLHAGEGHTAHESRKAGQVDPERTGCVYADDVLLPALRHVARFVDQEAICAPEDWDVSASVPASLPVDEG